MAPTAALVLALLAAASPARAEGSSGPWRLDEALDLPAPLTLSIDHRARYEFLDDEFRAGRSGDDQLLVYRTRVRARLEVAPWLTFGAELQDSRSILDTAETPLGTSIVNTAELLRAYADVTGPSVLGGTPTMQVGRLTIDLGSRRLVARNRYRNTSNAFTGVDLAWKNEAGTKLRLLYLLPIQRLPSDTASLRDGDVEYDNESFDVQFWGAFGRGVLPSGDALEVYFLGLHEDDSPGHPTMNRKLYTPGFRLRRAPKTGQVDYQIETAVQAGHSRASTSSSSPRLDHLAHFHHLELGYSFDAAWSPRIALQYDYASGDENPGDGDNERFDTLYGARRFDFGPTGIYGAFARANLNTPGLRLHVKPAPRVSSFAAVRAFWLASKRDAWTTASVSDPSGNSGRYVGTQAEIRVRWDVVPGNVSLQAGYAHLFAGSFIDDAPNSNRQGDSNYVYTQLLLTF